MCIVTELYHLDFSLSLKMKSFIAVLFFIGAVAAQNNTGTRALVDALVKRGETAVETTLKEINQLRQTGAEHLVHALENEVALVEALTVDLKIQIHELNKTHDIHHIHVIEEELLFRENRIQEELAIIRNQQQNRQPQNLTHAQLVAKAEDLIKKAQDVVAKQIHTREAHAVEAEMFRIEDLLKNMKENPNSPDLKRQEEQLARHETTIEQLINRLSRQPVA